MNQSSNGKLTITSWDTSETETRIICYIFTKPLHLFRIVSQQLSAQHRFWHVVRLNLAVDIRHITSAVCVVTFPLLFYAGSYIFPTSSRLYSEIFFHRCYLLLSLLHVGPWRWHPTLSEHIPRDVIGLGQKYHLVIKVWQTDKILKEKKLWQRQMESMASISKISILIANICFYQEMTEVLPLSPFPTTSGIRQLTWISHSTLHCFQES